MSIDKKPGSYAPKFTVIPDMERGYNPPAPMTPEQLEAPAPTPAELKALLRKVLATVVTPDRLQNLIHKLYESARQGDKWATEMLLDAIAQTKDKDQEAKDSHTVKPLSKKEIEQKLAELGWAKPSGGLNVTQSDSVTPKQ